MQAKSSRGNSPLVLLNMLTNRLSHCHPTPIIWFTHIRSAVFLRLFFSSPHLIFPKNWTDSIMSVYLTHTHTHAQSRVEITSSDHM